MKKIAFVIPWFGENIPGGAERECRETAKRLAKYFRTEILTTCVKDFYSDWDKNYWQEGLSQELGLTIRRFKVEKTDRKLFNYVNYKLMQGVVPVEIEQEAYIKNLFSCPGLTDFIEKNKNDYIFFFIPYMFPSTYYGVLAAPDNSFLIPCLHDESYAYMDLYKKIFSKTKGAIFHSETEAELAKKIYGISNEKIYLFGEGVNAETTSEEKQEEDYIICVGKKDSTKGVNILTDYFTRYKEKQHGELDNLKLIFVGPGKMEVEDEDIIDKGFVLEKEKNKLISNALFLCNPSQNESFSLAIMESWTLKTPVLVNGNCQATKEHCTKSNAGLWFESYSDFKKCCDFLLKNREIARQMGINGKKYVEENYSWDKIISKYKKLIENAN